MDDDRTKFLYKLVVVVQPELPNEEIRNYFSEVYLNLDEKVRSPDREMKIIIDLIPPVTEIAWPFSNIPKTLIRPTGQTFFPGEG
jgi:hypothetical protein